MKHLASSFCSAVIFYTIFPLPSTWINSWTRVARWSSSIGLIIGVMLALSGLFLQYLGFSDLVCAAVVTVLWIAITGGLHLDGAMDTADGLAVTEPQKRLAVMKDSTTGAFGAMTAVIIIVLKTVTATEILQNSWLLLILIPAWGRWGQLMAIALYPYLRKTGKGAFHKENLQIFPDLFLGSAFILSGSLCLLLFIVSPWWKIGVIISGCMAIALVPGYYFYHQLQGHTGDTYGAVVEWSEVFLLLWLSRF